VSEHQGLYARAARGIGRLLHARVIIEDVLEPGTGDESHQVFADDGLHVRARAGNEFIEGRARHAVTRDRLRIRRSKWHWIDAVVIFGPVALIMTIPVGFRVLHRTPGKVRHHDVFARVPSPPGAWFVVFDPLWRQGFTTVTVYLVGAGPGDADLLTVRAAQLLAEAEVVVHDRLISREVLALVNKRAARYDVGKAPGLAHSQEGINELLVALARDFEFVVRLKGGDPFVFGRGGEEVEALEAHGIDVRVVPGVTSAFAGPLLAGIPVTHRGVSHGVTVVTGSSVKGSRVDFACLANADVTLVVLMGVERRAEIAAELIEGGLAPSTPVGVVEWASTDQQRCLRCRLDELGASHVRAPAVLVIGEVAALDLGSVKTFAATWAFA